MDKQFYILLSLKTPKGFINYGQFFVGDDRQAANALFSELKGSTIISDDAVLHIDLMETIDELPVKTKTICCNLDELGSNSQLIARELFRLNNLEG